jgi:hypothetical protein
MKTKMKTRTRFKKTISSLTCAVLAAALLFSGTADVSAAKKSTWKTVTLNSSCTEGITYIPYEDKTLMELSDDGKTLICTYSEHKADGTLKKSINLKSALPKDILAKFTDGEVYLYWYSEDCQAFGCDADATNDLKRLYGKNIVITKKKHVSIDDNYNYVSSKHKKKNCDGEYLYSVKELLSNAKGTGAVSVNKIDNGYLADKNGKKIINIEFQKYEVPRDDVTCNLDDIYGETDIVLKSGESLSAKIKFTGTAMASPDYSEALYDSSLLTVKKDGTVTAKKGKYGVTLMRLANYKYDYWIYVTDGSSKMYKALQKYMEKDHGGAIVCSLTVGKNGKYTIKETPWY